MDDSQQQYPPSAFLFTVKIDGFADECSFQEVSGISFSIKTEELAEGGENRFKHKLPKEVSYPNIVLKRGLQLNSPLLLNWIKGAAEQFTFEPKTVVVSIIDSASKPLLSWNFVNAYPVAWKLNDLKAAESAYAIETLELAYNYFSVVTT